MVSKESWLSGHRETHLHLAIVALRIAVPLFSHKDVVALRIAVPLLHVNALPGFSCSGVTYRRPTTNTRCPRVTAIPSWCWRKMSTKRSGVAMSFHNLLVFQTYHRAYISNRFIKSAFTDFILIINIYQFCPFRFYTNSTHICNRFYTYLTYICNRFYTYLTHICNRFYTCLIDYIGLLPSNKS